MATVKERNARTISDTLVRREYVITGTTDEAEALSDMLAFAPTILNSLPRDTDNAVVEESGDGDAVFFGSVEYKRKSGTVSSGATQFSFDISGQSRNIQYSRSTISTHPATGLTAPDFNKAINVTGSGKDQSIAGVDIFSPEMDWVYSFTKADSAVTAAWLEGIYDSIGVVNSATWSAGIDFAAGTALFVGAQGQLRDTGDEWDITFRALITPNESGIDIGNGITGISKKGWELLWVYYEQSEDTVAKTIVTLPVAAYVEQVYPTGVLPTT